MPKFMKNDSECVIVLSNEEAREVWASLVGTPYSGDAASWLVACLEPYTAAPSPFTREPVVHHSLEQRLEEFTAEVNSRLETIEARAYALSDTFERERDSFENRVVQTLTDQARGMPENFDGRCEFGHAATRVVELVCRDVLEGKFYYDESGSRQEDEDDE